MQEEIQLSTASEDDVALDVTKLPSEEAAQIKEKQRIPLPMILDSLHAVGSALDHADDYVGTIINIFTASQGKDIQSRSWKEWQEIAQLVKYADEDQSKLTDMAIDLAFLRNSGRKNIVVAPAELDQVCASLSTVLQSAALKWKLVYNVDGSHAIPLWSNVEDGHVQEVISLNIWLPDQDRVKTDVAIHMHQPFAQTWILAGEGKEQTFDLNTTDDDMATHAQWAICWKGIDDDDNDKGLKDHCNSPTITTTGKLIRVLPRNIVLHTRDMSYSMPEGVFHKTEVEPDTIHATILFLDSSRGSIADASSVLRPISEIVSAPHQGSASATVPIIANLVADLRNWEILQWTGSEKSLRGEWEEALRSYRTALHICERNHWLDRPRYKHVCLGGIGKMYRMLGRYDQACTCLEQVVVGTPQSRFRVDCLGELAMVYRHMDRLEDSKRAAEEQYRGAKELNLEKFACRAIGNVGMVNYQLYLLNKDEDLLDSAIVQLNERIERAKRFGDIILEAIGYSRLSLCYIAKGNYEDAVKIAQQNYDLTCSQNDATKIGFAKAFLGRSLLFAGQKAKALALFNEPHGCSPIIALCNEISGEHRQYIVEMIEAGADLKLRDEKGYSALECAVYNGDNATAKIIIEGLKAQILREGGDIDTELPQLEYEAKLRKGYRDIFQDKLRPVLLGATKGSRLQKLRKTYAESLADEIENQQIFDVMKYVRYIDFLQCRRLPRSSDGYTREFVPGNGESLFIVFISYRWLLKRSSVGLGEFSPDDDSHTQYNRMLRAIKQFLDIHDEVNKDQLYIWLDFACIDQSNKKSGVAALPMNLAQCDAMISLVDETYSERAWCCLEVSVFQTLRAAYGVHLWYEHTIDPSTREESLRLGQWDKAINMSEKQVTLESDLPKLQFLQRQARLLG